MTDKELIETLLKASQSANDNIALSLLLKIAAERIGELNEKIVDLNWWAYPERIGQ